MRYLSATMLILMLIVFFVVLEYCYGFPGWYIERAWRDYQWSKHPKVMLTRFYVDGEVLCIRPGEANIAIDRDWLVVRESIWTDGYHHTEHNPDWIGRTWGSVAIRDEGTK